MLNSPSTKRVLASLIVLVGTQTLTTSCYIALPGFPGFGRDDEDEDADNDDDDDARRTCASSDDCPNIACICDDGSALGAPVNTRNCTNDRCETASQACPGSGEDFGYTWTGTVVAPDDGGDGGGGGGGGDECTSDTQCQVEAMGNFACDARSDCEVPDIEDCVPGINGTAKCVLVESASLSCDEVDGASSVPATSVEGESVIICGFAGVACVDGTCVE